MDPDQLGSKKSADLDLCCLSCFSNIIIKNFFCTLIMKTVKSNFNLKSQKSLFRFIQIKVVKLVALREVKTYKFLVFLIVKAGPQIRVLNWKLFFLFLNQNIWCGYSKELSRREGSFSSQNTCLNWWIRKKSQFNTKIICLTGPM